MSIATTTRFHSERTIELAALPERFDAFATLELPTGLVHKGTTIVVDGRAVRFADMHALQSLVDARIRFLDAGGDLIIGAPSVELQVTLELTGFEAMLAVIPGGAR